MHRSISAVLQFVNISLRLMNISLPFSTLWRYEMSNNCDIFWGRNEITIIAQFRLAKHREMFRNCSTTKIAQCTTTYVVNLRIKISVVISTLKGFQECLTIAVSSLWRIIIFNSGIFTCCNWKLEPWNQKPRKYTCYRTKNARRGTLNIYVNSKTIHTIIDYTACKNLVQRKHDADTGNNYVETIF